MDSCLTTPGPRKLPPQRAPREIRGPRVEAPPRVRAPCQQAQWKRTTKRTIGYPIYREYMCIYMYAYIYNIYVYYGQYQMLI